MDFQAIAVDGYPVDAQLTDIGTVGPETAHLARIYLGTPRALIWRHPSPDWRLFVLLVPLASRLSLMRNPIFAALVRDWGLSVRFVGIDTSQRLFDFRRLLSDSTLKKLVDALTVWLARMPLPGERGHAAGPYAQALPTTASAALHANEALDVLFAALADSMLTALESRRPDWPQHVARAHRLETGSPDSLFDRAARYPDFMASLRAALKTDTVDTAFYGRALRAIDLREESAERRIANLIEATLDAQVLDTLRRLKTGLHLGCYNWLADSPRHAGQRAYALARLPMFAQFFADTLAGGSAACTQLTASGAPLRDAAALPELAHAIDSGQDRAIVAALAQQFRVSDNTLRSLWRAPPDGLGIPSGWHLRHILQRLDALPARAWPQHAEGWREFAERAVPAQ